MSKMRDQEAPPGADREIRALVAGLPRVGELLAAEHDASRPGHHDTLREICQQPKTWRAAGQTADAQLAQVSRLVTESGVRADPAASVLLTGSGSSHYVGMCVAPPLQQAWGRYVRAVPCGDLLTQPDAYLPADARCLVVSFGRSGDSPESGAVVEALHARDGISQLLITCNRDGGLARRFQGRPRVAVVVLDERTNDRSLVMTSSLTNMVLTARLIERALVDGSVRGDTDELARCAEHIIRSHAERLEAVVRDPVRRVLYLGTGAGYGAALEAALKMLEMTGGRIETLTESFLGVRHGPMAAVDARTLIVCFLSSDPTCRAYEADVVRELNAKGVGARRILVGAHVDDDLMRDGDLGVDWGSVGHPADADACVLHVLVGQWLAFWACLREGMSPDAPSAAGIITRVVPPFTVHAPAAGAQ